jgi:hypothetical protein
VGGGRSSFTGVYIRILAVRDIKGLLKRRDTGITRSIVSGTSKTEPGGHAEANKGAPHAESGGNLKQSQ